MINQLRFSIMYYIRNMDIAFHLTGFLLRKTSNYQCPHCNQKDMSSLASSKIAYKYLLFFILNWSILFNLSFVIRRTGWEIEKRNQFKFSILICHKLYAESYGKVKEQWISSVYGTIYIYKNEKV